MGTPITRKSKIKNQPMKLPKKIPASTAIQWLRHRRKKNARAKWRFDKIDADLNPTMGNVP
jgi:hypothetical protein